jgi:hypothetical protein
MDTLPSDIRQSIMHLSDSVSAASLSTVNHDFASLPKDGPSRPFKVRTVIKDVVFRPQLYFKGLLSDINILFHDGRGTVLLWMKRSAQSMYPVYKLDGRDDSPSFVLNEDQEPVFFRFLERELSRVRGVDVYGPRKSEPVRTLVKRLRSAWGRRGDTFDGGERAILVFPMLL